jgi:hypothetical protein
MRMVVVWIGGVRVGVVVVVVLAQAGRGVTGAVVIGLVQVVVVILLGVVHVGVLGRLRRRQVSGGREIRPPGEGRPRDREPASEQRRAQDPHPRPHLHQGSIGLGETGGHPATRRGVVG